MHLLHMDEQNSEYFEDFLNETSLIGSYYIWVAIALPPRCFESPYNSFTSINSKILPVYIPWDREPLYTAMSLRYGVRREGLAPETFQWEG